MKKFFKILFMTISVVCLLGVGFVGLVTAGGKLGLSNGAIIYSSMIMVILTVATLLIWQYVKAVKAVKKLAAAGLIDINRYKNSDNNDTNNYHSIDMFNKYVDIKHIDIEGRYNPIPNSPTYNPHYDD